MAKKTPCTQTKEKIDPITLDTILAALREIEARLLSLEKKTPIINVYPQTPSPAYIPNPPQMPPYPKTYPGPWSGGTGDFTNPNIVNYGDSIHPCVRPPFKNVAQWGHDDFRNVSCS